jgi:hypothetical protein
MPSFAYLTIANQLRCQAGTQAIYGRLGPEDLFAANDVMAVEDQESLTFKVSRLDRTGTERAIRSQLPRRARRHCAVERRIIRRMAHRRGDDGSRRER